MQINIISLDRKFLKDGSAKIIVKADFIFKGYSGKITVIEKFSNQIRHSDYLVHSAGSFNTYDLYIAVRNKARLQLQYQVWKGQILEQQRKYSLILGKR